MQTKNFNFNLVWPLKVLFKSIYLWAVLWLFLLVYYAVSLGDGPNFKADYVVYFAQLFADMFLCVYSFLAYKNSKDKVTKNFLLIYFVGLIVGLCSTESYNILFNIVRLDNISSKINALWIFPYTIFLIVQIFSWSYLLYKKRATASVVKKTVTSIFPFIQSAIMVTFSILATSVFKNASFELNDGSQIANAILEMLLFIVISICLSRSKNKPLVYLASGLLFLMAFNIAHRFSYMTGLYYKTFDVAWLVSYLFMVFGVIWLSEKKENVIDFFDPSSLHVLTSSIFVVFSSIMFVIFIVFEFFITSLEINGVGQVKILLGNMPSIMIFSFTLSVLIGKLAAYRLSKPLKKIFKRIDLMQDKKTDPRKIKNEEYGIYEIDELDRFILKTIRELHTANNVKSEFIMNMSHDFRTPASGIYSMSNLIFKKTDDMKLKKHQKLVVDSSWQLLSLLDDVLDYAKLDNDSDEIVVSAISINHLLKEVVLFMAAKAAEKNISINCNHPSPDIIYHGNKVMLYRVIVNIVSNAVKFTEVGGVTICAYEKQSGNFENAITIVIDDTGIGMDKKHHDAIFDPFFKIESPETSKYGGVGLGLSSVKLMLNKIGGSVSVDSELGNGARFTVMLSNHKLIS